VFFRVSLVPAFSSLRLLERCHCNVLRSFSFKVLKEVALIDGIINTSEKVTRLLGCLNEPALQKDPRDIVLYLLKSETLIVRLRPFRGESVYPINNTTEEWAWVGLQREETHPSEYRSVWVGEYAHQSARHATAFAVSIDRSSGAIRVGNCESLRL
jgi:hypothetical protein